MASYLCQVVFLIGCGVLCVAAIPEYRSLGCWTDKPTRAIPSLERIDKINLDGSYLSRKNATRKCYQAAIAKGYHYFAVQNGGWCASSSNAGQTYKKYGKSKACKSDGEGGAWANAVYRINDYYNIGCWKDTSTRAIPTLEGTDRINLDGQYWKRVDAIQKCYQATIAKGYRYFAVQNGGWCASSSNAENTYKKYGLSKACKSDGEGAGWANAVYKISEFHSLGCWRDTQNRAILPLEGIDKINLRGSYWTRADAVEKCYQAAMAKGYRYFAVQNGGWCASRSNAGRTYNKYGESKACKPDGRGGPWANAVYKVKDYNSVGCWKDTGKRAIPTLEGIDKVNLKGSYTLRRDAVRKCYLAAMAKRYRYFAVQNGGWCASSATAEKTYKKYGLSKACKPFGKGGAWANEVYKINADFRPVLSMNVTYTFPPFSVSRGKLLANIDKIGKTYKVSFAFLPASYSAGVWHNILHMSSGNQDNAKYGNRIPGVWFSKRQPVGSRHRIYICSAVNGNKDHCYHSAPYLHKRKWHKFEISQRSIFGNVYVYTVKVNGRAVYARENAKPEEFKDVKLYASDPWYNGQSGFMKNLKIETTTQIVQPQ